MRFDFRSFLQFAIFVAVIVLLVRLLPLVLRTTSAAATSVAAFWWVPVILGVGGWVLWMLRKKNESD